MTQRSPILAASYFVLASAAILLTRLDGGVALLWVANAPLLTMLCRCGPRHWRSTIGWTAPASLAASALFGPVLWASPFLAGASMVEALLAAALLRRCIDGCDYFASVRSVVLFTAIAGVAAPMAGGLVAATAAADAFHKPWTALYIDWVMGHGLGILIASPIVLLLSGQDRLVSLRGLVPQLRGQGGVLLGIVACTTAGVFWQERLPLLFLPALPILLATFKLGRPGAALSIAIVALVGGSATALGHGPVMMTRLSHVAQLQFFQIYLVATYALSLPIAGALGQRRELLDALARSEARHRRIVDRSQDVIFETDLAGRWTFLSDAWERLVGSPAAAGLGTPGWRFVLREDRADLIAMLRRLAEQPSPTEAHAQWEGRFDTGTGVRWAGVSIGLLRDARGIVTGSFGAISDITQRKRTEAAIGESNRLFGMAGAIASIGYWRWNTAMDDIEWSDELFRIFGLPTGAVPPLSDVLDFYHPDDRAMVDEALRRALDEGADLDFAARLILPDGTLRHVLARGQAEHDEHGATTGLFGVFQDVTEQALAAETLRDSEARFRLITEQASDMIALIDTDGVCLFMSPASNAILGVDPAEMIGGRPLDRVLAEDRETVERYRATLRSGRQEPGTSARFRMRRADGDYAWLESSARLARIGDRACIVAVWRDVSRQVAIEAELRAARVQAEAAAVAKAGFLANMSHEIRTPMNGVIGFAELLLTSDLSDEQRRDAALIVESGRTMMKLLNDILDLSKIEAGQLDVVAEPFDLPHALRACGKLLGPSAAHKRLRLDVDIAGDVPQMVAGDALRVRQIVLNLLGNAIKFTERGAVTLSARLVDGGGEPWLAIAVRDTGIGIAHERQASIFEDFVQADHSITRRYGGTGLGLAISNRLAALMGGRIELESRAGHGTTVTLTIAARAVAGAPASRPVAPGPQAGSGRSARVLLAEDHDVNQLLVSAILTRAGHEVTVVADGVAAVDAVRAARGAGTPYDLVFMDMQMPLMDGLAATRAIRADPADAADRVPVVALTANAFAADLEACRAAGMDDHIAKPASMEALLAAVGRHAGVVPARPEPTAERPRFRPSEAATAKYAAQRGLALQSVDALVRDGTFTDVELEAVAHQLHKLAGTAGLFGEAPLGDAASAMEEGLSSWPQAERAARAAEAARLLRRAA